MPIVLLRTLLLAAALAFSPSGRAQSLIGSSDGGFQFVDREAVAQRALRSFDVLLSEVVVAPAGTPDRAMKAKAVAADTKAQFARQLALTLTRLEGDGLLTAEEVDDAVGKLRDELEFQLRQTVSAIADGYPVPPRMAEYDSRWRFAADIIHYTFAVRNSPASWLRFATYLLGGVMLAWLLNFALKRSASAASDAGQFRLAYFARSLAGPIYLSAIALGTYAGLTEVWIPGIAESWVDRLAELALIASLFWLLWNACRPLAQTAVSFVDKTYRGDVGPHIRNIVERCLRLAVLLLLGLVVIRVIFDSSLSGMLAGLGVLGVALSLVLRGTLQNVAASFTIFGDEPFRVGDMVIYDDHWGYIEDIGFRSTRLRTLDGYLITIPNHELIERSVVHAGSRRSIRRRFYIGLAYETPPAKIREAIDILEDILREHEGQPHDQPPHVVFESLGAYELRLLVEYFYAPPDFWQALRFDTTVNLQILERFAAAEIEIAFPTQKSVLSGELDLSTDSATMPTPAPDAS